MASRQRRPVVDFGALTAEEIDALTGHVREAWYAYARGDHDRAAEILAAYDAPAESREG